MLLSGQGTDLMVGSAFSDTAIKARGDLDNFRILHFATHGLVTPPQPSCAARPALVTSFGAQGSDGLLSFAEIFDLKLDADMVILSACDTAGEADVIATRETGLATGGGSALEGLVRAFIGAGSRSVLASHWPAPDDFDATARLINGLFAAAPGTASGEALLKAQQALMSDVDTSHPYYWAGFAVIGDGARPLVSQGARMVATGEVRPWRLHG
nr:CHAT domain-containing protein [Novosphingobium sp. THN1]